MAKTLEKRLCKAIKAKHHYLSKVQELIEKGVDCNLSYFDGDTRDFISPIQLARKNDRYRTLYLLYERRNSPTKEQLKKHLTFYVYHYRQGCQEENEILFDYMVSRLLYTRITTYSKIQLHTLIAALHDYDNVELRGNSLCEGSTQQILLQLRIYTLFQKIIEMTINSDNKMIEVIEDELLHNLETYYFLDGIYRIPVVITKVLIEYYRCIAKNVINKIKQLEIDKEYTIPSGWIAHAVCVSFRRISQTHISIRIDNPAPFILPNQHEIVLTMTSQNRVKPEVLGQLQVDDLEGNLDYFILLIDSVKRPWPLAEGYSLIYNLAGQICKLDRRQIENMSSFEKQAAANCFVKCFEPGFRIRFGTKYHKLCEQLLLREQNNANELATRCEQILFFERNNINPFEEFAEYQRHLDNLYARFNLLAKEDNINSLAVSERNRLQYQLKMSYKQHYQYLSRNRNRESCSSLVEKYVPLQFKINDTSIKLVNFFKEPRVLLLGDAGCGKTTVCQYATYGWACEDLWENTFEWLFYIKMRNLNSKLYPSRLDNYSLIDIIEGECFQGYKLNDLDKNRLTNQFENPSNILWILDGCDERTIPEYLHPIESQLFNKPHLLLTSRPYVTYDLKYDVKIQIQDFDDQDIENYIKKYFPIMFSDTINKCCSYIRDSEQLRETARIPACLEIICSLWESGNEIFEWGMTMGELYQKMCEYLLRRYLLKFHGQCTSALVGKDVYQQPNAIAFTHLEYLAFQATKSHRLTITGDELADISGSLFLSVLQIGLLISETRNSSPVLAENTYYFVHRSFQEYLCARHMIKALSSDCSREQEKVVQFTIGEKYNRRLQNTFRLFYELKRSILCTDKFWSAVDSEPRDLVGLRHCSRIIRWFPNGICIFSPEDEKNITKRTIDPVVAWISKKDRRAHYYSNIYLFEWFFDVIDHQYWLTAWKEDLFMKDASKRCYFIPDLWSTDNIDALKTIYNKIQENDIQALHRLITKGPMKGILKRLGIDPKLFTVDDKIETSERMIATQKIATERESIITPEEFKVLLQNYASFANLNRRTEALGIETWRLKIAPSALINIDNEMLKLLLRLSQENALFYRDFDFPVIHFLKLYAKQSDLDKGILRKVIIWITFSSTCILTAPLGEKKLIRVYNEDETFVDIEMDEKRRYSLTVAFSSARDAYGYSSFFRHNN